MVSLYCSLLFSRKEIIKFSEAALVSAHCNYLIGWIVIVRGNRPWNTINTKMNICLLVKNGNNNKKKKQNVKFVQTSFFSHLAALRPTLGHWQRGSLTYSMLITTLFQVWPEVHVKPCNNVGFHSKTECISGVRARNVPILNVTRYPTVSLTLKVYQKQMTI